MPNYSPDTVGVESERRSLRTPQGKACGSLASALTVSPGSRLPSSLFRIHRLVRTLQQRVGIEPILGVASEADARSNPQDGSFPDYRLDNGLGYLLHHGGESCGAARLSKYNHELM